jgi:hypothetical protein
MTRQLKVMLAIALVGLSATAAQAAVISVQPQIAGYFNTDFSPAPFPTPLPGGGTTNPGIPQVVQIDVYMQVEQLLPGEDSFGTAAFSVQALPNIGPNAHGEAHPDIDAGGWAANPLGNTDSNGAAPGGVVPVIATNADLGADSQDYVGILVQMATGAFTNAADQRRNVGEPGSAFGFPLLLGSAFYEWNGVGQVHFSLFPIEVSAKLASGGTFVQGVAPPSNVLTVGTDVPEPSSLVLLGSCFAGMILRRRAA